MSFAGQIIFEIIPETVMYMSVLHAVEYYVNTDQCTPSDDGGHSSRLIVLDASTANMSLATCSNRSHSNHNFRSSPVPHSETGPSLTPIPAKPRHHQQNYPSPQPWPTPLTTLHHRLLACRVSRTFTNRCYTATIMKSGTVH